jgi:hypothetical protein
MARNGIFGRGHAWAEALRDPVPMLDHCVAILALALFLAFVGGVTLAAEPGTVEQRRTCMPAPYRCCNEFVPIPIAWSISAKTCASSVRSVES